MTQKLIIEIYLCDHLRIFLITWWFQPFLYPLNLLLWPLKDFFARRPKLVSTNPYHFRIFHQKPRIFKKKKKNIPLQLQKKHTATTPDAFFPSNSWNAILFSFLNLVGPKRNITCFFFLISSEVVACSGRPGPGPITIHKIGSRSELLFIYSFMVGMFSLAVKYSNSEISRRWYFTLCTVYIREYYFTVIGAVVSEFRATVCHYIVNGIQKMCRCCAFKTNPRYTNTRWVVRTTIGDTLNTSNIYQ